MKKRRLLAAALMIFGALTLPTARAQPSDIGRTELARHDLGDGVREVVQVRVDFGPGAAFPRHSHPGVEVAHVLEGTMEYRFDGQAPVTLKTGSSLWIPPGTVHTARNVGTGKASELATYIVEKGKPLVVTAP